MLSISVIVLYSRRFVKALDFYSSIGYTLSRLEGGVMSKDTDHTINNLKDEIQELDDRIDDLENENFTLKERVAELDAEVGERDAQIAQMEEEA